MCNEEWIVVLFVLQFIAFVCLLIKFGRVQSALEELRQEIRKGPKPEGSRPPVSVRPAAPAPAVPPRAAPPPSELPKPNPAEPRIRSEFDHRSVTVLERIWNWICVGDEYRNPNVSSEYAVAAVWLIRVGVVTLLAGIGFLAKYMIEHSLFPPVLRVAVLAAVAVAI